jgi:hypothetical protein
MRHPEIGAQPGRDNRTMNLELVNLEEPSETRHFEKGRFDIVSFAPTNCSTSTICGKHRIVVGAIVQSTNTGSFLREEGARGGVRHQHLHACTARRAIHRLTQHDRAIGNTLASECTAQRVPHLDADKY